MTGIGNRLSTLTSILRGDWVRVVPTRSLVLATTLLVAPLTSFGFERIPEESGFSGFVNLGVGYLKSKSNMVAGNDFGDVGQDTIRSLNDTPGSKSDAIPLLNLEVAYTFAQPRTQIIAGNRLEDFVRFDTTAQLGVRKELADSSIIGGSFVFSAIPTEVWADPYVINQKRDDTDRKSPGARLEYSYILGSNFGAEFTWRNIKIDDELSGRTQLGLPEQQARLLDREGDSYALELRYLFRFAQNKQRLIPAFRYTKFDLDGDAMASDNYLLQLTYLYLGDRWNIAANALYAYADYDATNPIYAKKREDDIYGGGVQVFYERPFNVDKLSLVGTLAFYKDDANIKFYDTDIGLIGLSAFYRF